MSPALLGALRPLEGLELEGVEEGLGRGRRERPSVAPEVAAPVVEAPLVERVGRQIDVEGDVVGPVRAADVLAVPVPREEERQGLAGPRPGPQRRGAGARAPRRLEAQYRAVDGGERRRRPTAVPRRSSTCTRLAASPL